MTKTDALGDVEIIVQADDSPDASWLEQEGWEDRLAQYQAGEFGFIGVQATAELKIPCGHDSWIVQHITSPGLWGIEDDSGEDYIREVAAEEVETLRDMLASLGVTLEQPDVDKLDIRYS